MARTAYTLPVTSTLSSTDRIADAAEFGLVQSIGQALVVTRSLGTTLEPTSDKPCLARRWLDFGPQNDPGADAGLWLVSPTMGYVADWVRGTVYEVEINWFDDEPTADDWTLVESAIVDEWHELRTTWAAEGHLTDPEFAAALRAMTRVLSTTLRMRPNQFRVGGRRID